MYVFVIRVSMTFKTLQGVNQQTQLVIAVPKNLPVIADLFSVPQIIYFLKF